MILSDERKQRLIAHNDQIADQRDQWIQRNQFFYDQEIKYLRFLIPQESCVLEVGCGNGYMLNALEPSHGVGVDFSQNFINQACEKFPKLNFICADVEREDTYERINETFDYVLISDALGFFKDCQHALTLIKKVCHKDTRIIIAYHNCLWDPILSFAEKLGKKMSQIDHNYLSTDDIHNLLTLAGYDFVKQDFRQLIPKKWFGIGSFVNKFIGTLPIIRKLCLRNYVIARVAADHPKSLSASIIVTCRNEEGNIENAVKRIPQFTDDIEIIFVEGHSKDNTLEEIHRVKECYPDLNIRVFKQEGKGKGDAVRLGFDKATKDILMILDGDLTTPPEDLPKFYEAISSGLGEYVQGTRLVYPMESQAMQYLNYLGNKFFSIMFSYLLNQRFTDTLCGTKVLTRNNYQKLKKNRSYFGDFDPFGDFDLIFGASKLNLKVIEIPVRYGARTYGQTNISRFSHGWLLIKMVIYAYRKLKLL